MKRVSILLMVMVLLVSACANKKKLKEQEIAHKNAPDWVKNRPISNAYYIGIGISNPKSDPENYRNTAKKNALNDLASEIEVKIQANSILYSLEKKGEYTEDYLSTIKLNSNLNLEGFEMVDAFEGADFYYVYYRLSKADYAANEAKKRDEASSKAAQFIATARSFKNQGNYNLALDNYLQALLAVNDYLGEALMVKINDETSGYIGNLLISETSQVVSNLSLTTPEDLILFSFLNREKPVGVIFSNPNGKPIANLPVRIKNTSEVSKPLETATNNAGFIQLSPADLNIKKATGNIKFELKVQQMLSEQMASNKLVKTFLANLKPFEQTMAYKIEYPIVYISSVEHNMNKPVGTNFLENALKQSATERGFSLGQNANQSEVLVKVEANTRENTVNYELYSAVLNGKIEFIDAKSGKTIYTYPIVNQKGVGLNYLAAGTDAYQKTGELLKKEAFQSFLKSFN